MRFFLLFKLGDWPYVVLKMARFKPLRFLFRFRSEVFLLFHRWNLPNKFKTSLWHWNVKWSTLVIFTRFLQHKSFFLPESKCSLSPLSWNLWNLRPLNRKFIGLCCKTYKLLFLGDFFLRFCISAIFWKNEIFGEIG